MNNQKPLLLGKTCEVERKNKKKIYRYTREELERMAELVDIPITSQTSNNYLCETLRTITNDNKLNSYEDFENYALHLDILNKYPSLNDYIMFEKEFYIIDKFFKNFDNIAYFSEIVQKIGMPSNHGFLYKLNYILNEKSIDVLLKSARNDNTDNLYHEYLAGLCINEFSKYFPFFPKTYKLGAYNDDISWDYFLTSSGITNLAMNIVHYIHDLDPTNFEDNTKISCQSSKHICIFTQYLNLKDTLHTNLYKYIVYPNVYNSLHTVSLTRHILLLYLIYKTLSQLADYFTHYDLHLGNIGIYEIPQNKCITLNITLDSDTIQLKTNQLPIFIDFGRSFFNCQNLNASLNSSEKLMKSVCSLDNTNQDVSQRLCNDKCGDNKGYHFCGNLLQDGTFTNTDTNNYWINRVKRNMSHDLRLLVTIYRQFDFNSLDQTKTYIIQFIELLYNINYQDEYGTRESIPGQSDLISNVHDAANALERIIKLPEFKTDLYYLLSIKDSNSYGTLDLNFTSGNFKEFMFHKL